MEVRILNQAQGLSNRKENLSIMRPAIKGLSETQSCSLDEEPNGQIPSQVTAKSQWRVEAQDFSPRMVSP
jgi:hypothetical protein